MYRPIITATISITFHEMEQAIEEQGIKGGGHTKAIKE